MLRIRDDVFVGLTIGGIEYPVESTGLVHLKIPASVDTQVPMLEVQLVDTLGFFTNKITLAEGVPIVVYLGESRAKYETYKFRVHTYKDVKQGGAGLWTIIGYLDVPTFFLATADKPLRGTSYAVQQELARQSGLRFSGDQTADDQLWIPKNSRVSQFSKELCAHAYAGASSYMRVAVTQEAELRYRDIGRYAVRQGMPAFTSTGSQPRNKVFQMVDSRTVSKGGRNNAAGGYGCRIIMQGPEGQTEVDKLVFRRMSRYLDINSGVRDAVRGAEGSPGVQEVRFAPINCGNVHPKYWEAEYQNRRMGQLFSLGAIFMTEQRTDVQLLDYVQYMPSNAPGAVGPELRDQVTGYYVVTAKSFVVQMATYVECFEAYTMGSNADPAAAGSQE